MPTESLTLNGEVLISITFPGGANLKLAETSFDASGSSVSVFNGLVFCRDQRYVGPSIP